VTAPEVAEPAASPRPAPGGSPAAAGAPSLRPATEPPEDRGLARDEVRLQALGERGVADARVRDLPRLLRRGDLLVANRSALRPAAVDAEPATPDTGAPPRFLLHLAQRYGPGAWLVEPRVDEATPGPLDLPLGTRLRVAGLDARLLGSYPGLPRLRFLHVDGAANGGRDLAEAAERHGRPVRYGHLRARPPRSAYATVFGDRPGSAEMASAGRPFTAALLQALRARGVGLTRITLHAGVSGLEAPEDDEALQVPAEAFEVSAGAARAVNEALADGRRVVAIGTGAVRALETAWDGRSVRAVRGWTRTVLRPGRSGGFLSGVLTGLHDAEASHLRLLRAVVGERRVSDAYRAATDAGLLAHEFGDVQLLWRQGAAG
jgi:S-adenosylmethionine:tRNA ribosyltransferase-isomerase